MLKIIPRYNQRIREWESEGVIQLENMSFYISYRNISQDYDLVTEGFGEFYPFRDRCDKKYDPECLNSSVYYYSTSLPILYDQDSVVLISSVDGFAVFNETVKFQDMIYLNKKEIGCSGDNTYFLISAYSIVRYAVMLVVGATVSGIHRAICVRFICIFLRSISAFITTISRILFS